jgi:UMF1 family MFS transporter
MYDWADSAFYLVVIAAVFPDFFSTVAGETLPPNVATGRYAWATTIAVAIAAVLGPTLGGIADSRGLKKKMLGTFVAIGVISTLMMTSIDEGEWRYAALIFIVANVAVSAGRVFYESLLPHVAAHDEMDRVSTSAYALGYLGSGALLVLNLAWIISPETFGIPDTVAAIKLSFVSVAIWWLVFSLPLFRRVSEPTLRSSGDDAQAGSPVSTVFARLMATLVELRGYRHAFMMLVAFLLYNDGIQTTIRMATIYGAEIGIDRNARIAAFVLVQFVGVPSTFVFGALADRIGAKTAILVGLSIYTATTLLAFFMTTAAHFFALAVLIGTVQGGCQALSRSLFARMIPKHKSSEYFGFFSVFEKFGGVAGPAVFGTSITLLGSSRAAIVSVMMFFVAGGLVLTRVNVTEGEAQAARATRALNGTGTQDGQLAGDNSTGRAARDQGRNSRG